MPKNERRDWNKSKKARRMYKTLCQTTPSNAVIRLFLKKKNSLLKDLPVSLRNFGAKGLARDQLAKLVWVYKQQGQGSADAYMNQILKRRAGHKANLGIRRRNRSKKARKDKRKRTMAQLERQVFHS